MDVYNHYQGLLEVFTKCANESSFGIPDSRVKLTKLHPPAATWYQLELQAGYLSLKTDISDGHINGIAEAWGLPSGELEILIYPREQIRIDDPWNIKRSQVEIAYLFYNIELDKTALLLGLHFDFGVKNDIDEPEVAHPLFHVTLTPSPMNLKGILHHRKVDTTRMEGIPSVRLPTAHMTLPSVLLSVAADHFQPAAFNKFLRYMRGEGNYPTMTNNLFEQRMKKQKNRMRSCAWYADLPPVTVI